jgi:hypothetical protein
MDRYARPPVTAVGLDAGPRWPVERHVMLRVEHVVNQVARSHRGASEADIAREISDRLRGLGVAPLPRHVHQYAELIARLPAA